MAPVIMAPVIQSAGGYPQYPMDVMQNSHSNSSEDGDDSNDSVDRNDKYKRGKGKSAFQRTKMCVHFLKGRCRAGVECPWAHGADELRGRPDLRKTRLCELFIKGKCPLDSEQCVFAHSREELRATEDLYKTTLCRFWLVGNCKAGVACRHAHGKAELREKVPQVGARDVSASEAAEPGVPQPPPGLEYMCQPVDPITPAKVQLHKLDCGLLPPTSHKFKGFQRNQFVPDAYAEKPGLFSANQSDNKPIDYMSAFNSKIIADIGSTLDQDLFGPCAFSRTGGNSPSTMLSSSYDIPVQLSPSSLDKIGSLQIPEPIGRPRFAHKNKITQEAAVDCASDPLIADMLRQLEQMNVNSLKL